MCRQAGKRRRGFGPKFRFLSRPNDSFPRSKNLGQTCAGNHIASETAGVVPGQSRLRHRSSAALGIALHAIGHILRKHHRIGEKENFVLPQAILNDIVRVHKIHRNVLFEEGAIQAKQRIAFGIAELGERRLRASHHRGKAVIKNGNLPLRWRGVQNV